MLVSYTANQHFMCYDGALWVGGSLRGDGPEIAPAGGGRGDYCRASLAALVVSGKTHQGIRAEAHIGLVGA